MTAEKWTSAFLDEMREIGDPPADRAVAALFESGGVYSVRALMQKLIENDQAAPEQLPPELKEYIESTGHIPSVDLSTIEGGQRMFEKYGPEILMVLACYSLPASYAARKGVQVLYRSGYLNNRANHRLFETTQMVMDVMSPGGLGASGHGIRTAQKVRLMHAAIRRLILTDTEHAWDPGLGIPINQEDLTGTLMVFTHLIVDGLSKLGIAPPPEEQRGFLEAWRVIARIMGIQEALIPETMAESKMLCDLIQSRQVQICPEGKAMNDALLDMLEHQMPPGPWRSWPAALERHFLPGELADGFGIPNHSLEERLLDRAAEFVQEHDSGAGELARGLWLIRRFSLLMIQGLLTMKLGGKRSPFIIPTNLHHEWARSHRMSVWDQLRR